MHFKSRVARRLYMTREASTTGSLTPTVGIHQTKYNILSSERQSGSFQEKSENFKMFSYLAPHPGLATRRPALKQAKTSRGHSVYRGVILWHESLLELRISYLLQTWQNVREIHSQYPRVTYNDSDGKTRTHTFDYYVVFEDGRRLAIAVKLSSKRVVMLDLLARIEEAGIAEHGGARLADETCLMTEVEGNRDSFHNCSEILASRETCHPYAEQELCEIVERMTGRFRFMTLLSGCDDVAARRAAVWRLIDLRKLVPVGTGRINELTWLTRTAEDTSALMSHRTVATL